MGKTKNKFNQFVGFVKNKADEVAADFQNKVNGIRDGVTGYLGNLAKEVWRVPSYSRYRNATGGDGFEPPNPEITPPVPTVPETVENPITPEPVPTVPENGNDSTGGGAVGVNETEEKITSYGDALAAIEKSIKDHTAFLESNAASEKTRAEAEAEKNYQHSVADANAAYLRNLATYGARAEALSGMGLSGSGYSDYLGGKAYSQMRNDVMQAGSDKNSAIRAANSDYSRALNDARTAELDRMLEINKEKGLYLDNLQKEAEGKKQALKSELLTMAQNGASEDDIRAYIEASGISLSDDEWKAAGTVASNTAKKIKAEIVASALANGYDLNTIKAIAAASGVVFGEDETGEIEAAIDSIKSEVKTEEEKQAANTILTNLLSSEGGVNSLTKSELEEYIRSFGLNPVSGTGASIMALHDGHENITSGNNKYEGEKTDAELLKGATAKATGKKGEGGNITISYKNEKFYVERDSDNRVPVDSKLAGILTDTYREANDLSMKEWQEMADEDVEGSVVKHKGIFYVYLNTKGEGYGWVKTRERQTDGLWGGDVSYDKLVEKTGGRGGSVRTAMDFGNDLNLLNYSGKNGSELRIKYNDNTYDLKIESGVTDKNKNDELTEFYKAQGGYWNPDDDADNGGKVVYYNGNLYAYVPRRKIAWGGTKEEHRWALLSDTNDSKRDFNRLLRAMTE